MKHFSKSFLSVLLVLLLAAAALTGCTNAEAPKSSGSTTEAASSPATAAQADASSGTTEAKADQPVEMGEGDTLFYFNVTFSNGETSSYAIHTDAATLGEALVKLDLISGDESQNGLYVKTVAGETLDYDTDKAYWALYEGEDYASTGVDGIAITDGASYAFVATKG